MSGKLESLTAEVRALIEARGNVALTNEEYASQLDSFVVGNGFDIFSDAETITRESVKLARSSRFQRHGAGFGNCR